MAGHRIVAIVQIYNELERGNLERFMTHVRPLVDELVVYDDGSTDGSGRYARRFTAHVIRGRANDFVNERTHRNELLQAALKLNPDFILWLDADEVLTDGAGEALQRVAAQATKQQLDGVALREINLWRSHSWRRIDNGYDGWFVRLWRVTSSLAFAPSRPGLHQRLYPESIEKIERTEDFAVIHYGFSSVDRILHKFLNYRRHGQTGWALARLIDESTLQLEAVSDERFPADLRFNSPQPEPYPIDWWLLEAERRSADLLRPIVSIVVLIYKSTAWLRFSYDQVLRCADLRNTEVLFVANDAAEHVLRYLRSHYIPHIDFQNTPEHRQEWYINNVYRAYNCGGQAARGKFILFVNSDMAFTPGWVEALLEHYDGSNCVAARLIESGKMPSGQYGISRNFGRSISEFDEPGFRKQAKTLAEPRLCDGGLFMPLLVAKDDFIGVGGYPEGNVIQGSDPFRPAIAKRGEPMITGDAVLMQKLRQRGLKHQTAFDVISYHFQEGEIDDAGKSESEPQAELVAISNDWLTGRMGERTMWNVLAERLPSTVELDQSTVGQGVGFETRARSALNLRHRDVKVIIQNASYMQLVDPGRASIVYLQDNLRQMQRPTAQQEDNLKRAAVRITNSWLTARSYPEYNFEIIPIGVDHERFKPMDQKAIQQDLSLPEKPIAIFVGDLSPTKGWEEIKAIIERRDDLHWIIVSKSAERYERANVSMYNRVDHALLAKLYNAADVFVVGSPVETQCLAAIEAAMCNVPVVMRLTGIFGDLSGQERARVGVFGDDFEAGIMQVLSARKSLQPREAMIEYGLTLDTMIDRWQRLLTKVMQDVVQAESISRHLPTSQRLVLKVRRATRSVATGAVGLVRSTTGAVGIAKTAVKAILPKRWTLALAKMIHDRRR